MKKTQYNPIDVANYIVWRANAIEKPITHLKLQKLLYYVVAKHLQKYNHYLITENIVKWQYGPVVKSVYHQFKILGSAPITELSEYMIKDPNKLFSFEWADVDEITHNINADKEVEDTVTLVLKDLIDKNPFALVNITHREPAWRNFEERILKGGEPEYSREELMVASYV